MVAMLVGVEPRYLALLAFVAVQRLLELAWSRRNLRGLADPRPSQGASDYRWMVAIHVALIALPAIEAGLRQRPPPAPVFWSALALFALAQVVRYWALASLGRAWNARAVVDPRLGVVATGPYRWIRHPNYLAILLEFVAVPAAGGAWISLVVVNLVHAPILARRIRAEEARLGEVPGYAASMASKGRFLPRL